MSQSKYVFVTGGVTSSLGKGIISASLAKLIQSRGLKTTIQKFDPYINAGHNFISFYRVGSGDLIKMSGNTTNQFIGLSAVYFV